MTSKKEKSKEEKKKPKTNSFQQQNLKAWQPLLTPPLVITTFFIISVLFAIIGAVVLDASSKVVEYTKRYDAKDDKRGTTKNITINIDKDMEPPIYFYYKLTEFYQNHRRYVKSRSDAQLRGDLTKKSYPGCEPMERDPNTTKILYPCGLIANSFFNDTFDLPTITHNGTIVPIKWIRKGIAWQSDKDQKFKKVDTTTDEFNKRFSLYYWDKKLPEVTNEDFIVWMRTAGLPTFKKLNKKILNYTFKKGSTFNVKVTNNFPVDSFGGTKSIVLSTTTWLGGKNDFLGWAYVTVSILCFVLALAFLGKNRHSPRKLGDMTYFQFGKKLST